MPIETIPETGQNYYLLAFDKNGVERAEGNNGLLSARLLASLATEKPTDVFFFSHGWMGDMDAARDQYHRWIRAMGRLKDDSNAMGGDFKPVWIGMHWPSLPFGNEELAGASFDVSDDDAPGLSPEQLVDAYVERLGLGEESRPLIQQVVDTNRTFAAAAELPAEAADSYRRLAEMADRNGAQGLSAPPDADGAPFDPDRAFKAGNAAGAGANFGGGFLGGILGPLRQLSYWTMKKRARSIGESGMHSFLAALMHAAPNARIHLMGHSFGCIVVSSMLGGAGGRQPLPRAVDSAALVQGAVSLWAFADAIPRFTGKGYFNPWLARNVVSGPLIVTRSKFDKAVGTLYPLASASVLAAPDFDLADDESLPRFGAIGTYGIRGLSSAVDCDMLAETQPYTFEKGKVYNLESSAFIRKGDGASGAHSDIDGPQVAHAIWQAALV